MKCPKCHAESLADALFCEECSTALEVTCPMCRTGNRPTAKFCRKCRASLAATPASGSTPRAYTPKHLADKILQSKSALEGERKQVTVLFADVQGSMDLAEQLDPEEWHRILDRFFEILNEGVHRFEGTVNQYTGDGIMALFGAPIAHEDHAQRACYAALHLRAALRAYGDELRIAQGLSCVFRLGLNSGEVVVGKIGDDLRMDYTAQGHTVGLAQRMEQLAPADGIALSQHTQKLVEGFFNLRSLGPLSIKGVRDPVGVFVLEGVGQLRTRFDRSRARGLSKFVGRTAETATLNAALEQALAGHGQVIGIVADAGSGKSRLCYEFIETCRAKGLHVRTTAGVAHGKNVPLLPVLEFYRGTFGITQNDDASAARQKIAGSVIENDESLVTQLPLLFEFLGVPDPDKPVQIELGPERQRALLSALKRFTHARSRREPQVILFEDLHWIDEATGAFLENLVDAADSSRTLLVVNFRPEYRVDWMRRSYYQQLTLAPLDARAFAEMLGETLGTDPSLGDLVARIHARSVGNPFFAEEIVLSLIESGALTGAAGAYRLTQNAASLDIPASVQVVLAARIDRLGEREKNVLQTASVIGREFTESLLLRVANIEAAALNTALHVLVQAEFLQETAVYPEVEYQFKHPLTQEVALGSQLRERRALAHAAVAAALIELHSNNLDEQAALLAHHYEAAGNAAEAIRWHERAAGWFDKRDVTAARLHWARLLTLASDEPEPAQARAALRACTRLMHLDAIQMRLDFASHEALYRRGRGLAARLDEPDLEFALVGAFSRSSAMSGNESRALEAAQEALRLAPQAHDPRVYADVFYAVGVTFGYAGRNADGLVAIDAALASGKVTLSNPAALARLLMTRVQALVAVGRLPDARATLHRMDELLAQEHEVLLVANAETARCNELVASGCPEHALGRIARSVQIADEAGARFFRLMARSRLAESQLFNGLPHVALQTIEEIAAIANETDVGAIPLIYTIDVLRTRALVALGDVASAQTLIEQSIATSSDQSPFPRAVRLAVLAEVLIASNRAGEVVRIESSLNEAAEIAERIARPGLQAEIHTQRAHLACSLGDEAGWRRELREALRIYTEMDATGWMARIERELAS